MAGSRYHVRQSDVTPYSPANHTGTRNFRLIGRETVGAKQVEMLIGEIERGQGALPHAHPGIEQVCYLLEGAARVEVGGEQFELAPGEACFFPVGRLVEDEDPRICDERAREGDGDLCAAVRGEPRPP